MTYKYISRQIASAVVTCLKNYTHVLHFVGFCQFYLHDLGLLHWHGHSMSEAYQKNMRKYNSRIRCEPSNQRNENVQVLYYRTRPSLCISTTEGWACNTCEKHRLKLKKTMTAIVSQLCLSQCMASKWCNNSYRLVRSITTTSFEHLWCWLVSPSFINPFHTNCRILKYPIRKDISHHIYEYILPIFSLSMCYIAGALDSACWHWNTLEWCQLNAFQASSVMHLVF